MGALIQPLLCGYVVFYISLLKGLYIFKKIIYSLNQNILTINFLTKLKFGHAKIKFFGR
jgi:hypothetical protein